MKTHIYTLILLFVFLSSLSFCQNDVKKGIKIGIDVANIFTKPPSSFNRTYDYMIGAFTEIHICSFEQGSIFIRTELNYERVHYYHQSKYTYGVDTIYNNWNGLNYALIDEDFSFHIIEIALLPTYRMKVNKRTSIEFYIGGSLGVGDKKLKIKYIGQNRLMFDPYDEYEDGLGGETCINVGCSLYYSPLVFEVKYKNSNVQSASYSENVNKLYFQFGIAI